MDKSQSWVIDQLLRTGGSDARDPDVIGMHLEWGVKWGHANAVNKGVRSFAMLTDKWGQMAKKVREQGRRAEKEGHPYTALDNYFMATQYYCRAQWSVWEFNDELRDLNRAKNECYDKVVELSEYPMERLEIPFGKKSLPAVLHLPSKQGRYPLVVLFPGMDQSKEQVVNALNNRYVRRGVACLAVDGPGQGESLAMREILVEQDSFDRAGKAAMDVISKHKNVRPDRISVFGNSMGSYWAPRVAAADDRYIACAAQAACVQPGMKTIFGEAYPPFRHRFMFMAGIEDDEEFDEFAEGMTLEGVAEKIKVPFLFVAGKYDQLCPVKYTRELYGRIKSPKLFMVFDGEFHSLGKVAPEACDFVADWTVDRLNGKPVRKTGWVEVPPV